MSLINQMLKDLDARHDADARARLHREVRPLPAGDDNRGLRLAVVVLLVLALLSSAWWAYPRLLAERRPPAPVAATVAEPAAPAAVSAALVVPQPPAADAVATAAVSATAAEQSPVAEAMMPGAGGLKMSAMLDRVPDALPVEARPARSPPRRETPAMPPVASATERATKAAPPALPAAPVVEKLAPAGKGGREQSEADYRRAMTLVNGARVQEATDVLLDVLSRDGSHTASRQLLARLLIEQRRLDEAYAILAEGLALQPGQVGWAMTLARLQVERSDLAGLRARCRLPSSMRPAMPTISVLRPTCSSALVSTRLPSSSTRGRSVLRRVKAAGGWDSGWRWNPTSVPPRPARPSCVLAPPVRSTPTCRRWSIRSCADQSRSAAPANPAPGPRHTGSWPGRWLLRLGRPA